MLLHILHTDVEPRRAALYDAAARDELVLRAWQAGVVIAVPLARGHARGMLTIWADGAFLDAWRSGPGGAGARSLLSRFAMDRAAPRELTFETGTGTSDGTSGLAGRGAAPAPPRPCSFEAPD